MRPISRICRFTLVAVVVAAGLGISHIPAVAQNSVGNPGFETCWLDVNGGLDSLHARMMDPGYWWPMYVLPSRVATFAWNASAAHSRAYVVSIDTRA